MEMEMEIKRFIIENWLMKLWRLANPKSAEPMSQFEGHQGGEFSLT